MSHLEVDTGITRFYRTDLYVQHDSLFWVEIAPHSDANTKIRVLKDFLITFWNASSSCLQMADRSQKTKKWGAHTDHKSQMESRFSPSSGEIPEGTPGSPGSRRMGWDWPSRAEGARPPNGPASPAAPRPGAGPGRQGRPRRPPSCHPAAPAVARGLSEGRGRRGRRRRRRERGRPPRTSAGCRGPRSTPTWRGP